MLRYPHLIEAVHYVSTKMPALLTSAGSDAVELVGAVAKLLQDRPGTFEVQLVNDDNEEIELEDPGDLPTSCFLFIKENPVRVH